MSTFVSPGVYTRELDFSQVTPPVSDTVTGLVGFAKRGKINHPYHVTNVDQLIKVFGTPYTTEFFVHCALEFLNHGGREIWMVRVADGTEDTATVTLLDGTSADTLQVTAESPGTGYNNWKIKIETGSVASTIKFSVFEDTGAVLEVFDKIKMTPTTDANFIETRVNGVSQYVVVTALGTAVPVNGLFTLTGGLDGIDTDPSTLIGTIDPLTSARTGLQVFRDDTMPIQLLACPGKSDKTVQAELIDISATRRDCLSILDPPQGLGDAAIVDYVNGTGTYVGTQLLDSSYATIYWPWVKKNDPYNRVTLSMPPSGFALGVYAFNDFVAFPWEAPAGVNRGLLTQATGLDFSAGQGSRDLVYVNNVNPIATLGGSGIALWGQKTLQRVTSALDRINVRRMMLHIERAITQALYSVVFEPNDATLWRQITAIIESALTPVAANRGIAKYLVVWNETTNTPDVIDRNESRGKVFITPVHAAEMIELTFILMRTGATFSESIGG